MALQTAVNSYSSKSIKPSPGIFCKQTQTSPDSGLSYDASQQLLLIQIGTLEHSQATQFNHLLVFALEPMGLYMALQTYSMVTITADRTGNCKQGDHGWGPIRPPPGRSRKWPTVVLEGASSASESESRAKLQSDVRFWLHEIQGGMKIVLTLSINRQRPKIVIEKWELEGDQPHRTQQATVYRRKNNRRYVRGGLTIEFDKLCLRATRIPRERTLGVNLVVAGVLGRVILDSQYSAFLCSWGSSCF